MNFLAIILCNDQQQGSFSRVSGFLIILALIIWASWITLQTKVIPDVPAYWLYLVTGLYGIGKAVDGIRGTLTAIKGAANADQPDK